MTVLQVKIQPVAKYDWEHKYYYGNLIAVSNLYVAYAIRGRFAHFSVAVCCCSFSTLLWIKCGWDSNEWFVIVYRSQVQTIILWSACCNWARRSVRCWRASPVQSQTLPSPTWTPPSWPAWMRLETCSFGSSLVTTAKYSILCRWKFTRYSFYVYVLCIPEGSRPLMMF